MTVKSPNYTQVPNDLLGSIQKGGSIAPGLMAEMEGSQLKVYLAVCRMTVGYHRDSRRLSIRKMVTLTGLSKPAVQDAAKWLESRQLIERVQDGGVTEWQMVFIDVEPEEVGNSVTASDEVDNAGWVSELPRAGNSVTQGGQVSYPPSKKETLKETIKESSSEIDIIEQPKPTTTPDKKKQLNALGDAVAEICAYDLCAISDRKRDDLKKTVIYLFEQGAKVAEVLAFKSWFVGRRRDGKTVAWPQVIREDWLAFRAESQTRQSKSAQKPDVAYVPVPPEAETPTADALSVDDIRAMREQFIARQGAS